MFWDNGKLQTLSVVLAILPIQEGSQVVVQGQVPVLAAGKSQVVTLTTPDGVIGVYKELADKAVEGKKVRDWAVYDKE